MFHGVPVYSVFVMIRETKSPSTPVKEAEGKVYDVLDPLDPTYSRCVQFGLIPAVFTVSGLMFLYFKRILGGRVRIFHILGLPADSLCGEDLSMPVPTAALG